MSEWKQRAIFAWVVGQVVGGTIVGLLLLTPHPTPHTVVVMLVWSTLCGTSLNVTLKRFDEQA